MNIEGEQGRSFREGDTFEFSLVRIARYADAGAIVVRISKVKIKVNCVSH